MTITAQVITDSISPAGKRLTTFQLRYPRFIHAEFMTHRVFSRNASSSRAIPVARMIEDLRRDPAMPVYWGSHKSGMQAGEELTGQVQQDVIDQWYIAMEHAIASAESMIEFGLHKQIANRILEPWAHINVVVTATEWANFFALRAHADAQPEIRALAEAMQAAMAASIPTLLRPGQWHLPYVTIEEWRDAYHGPSQSPELNLLKMVSVARCARVSYLTHDGRKTTVEEDLALAEKLVVATPLHASPAEHQATPDTLWNGEVSNPLREDYNEPHLHGNFVGWCQFRKMLPNEYVHG